VGPDDFRKIGFNSDVVLGTRTIHVQTEVVGTVEYTARTMALEGGVVLLTQKTVLPPGVQGQAAVEALVHAQHTQIVARVQGGQVG
jgi:hypothetical protein